MITFEISKESNIPVYLQIYSYIRNEIETGKIKTDEKLPSKRALASHMNVSIVTVENAYGQLVAEGYIRSEAGRGFFAEKYEISVETEEKPKVSETYSEVKYNFGTNAADTSLFPFSVWAKLSRATLNEKTTDLLNSCDFRGLRQLREEISHHLRRFRGMDVSPDRIVIGAGSEYLIGMIIKLLGRDMAYGVENPGYRKIYDVFSINSSRVFPVPVDEQGASVSAISGFGINVLHVTPSHHFPLGVTMPVTRKQQLLKWSYEKSERYIIEDDCDCEFNYGSRPLPALQSYDRHGTVIYLNTFTRTIAPSVRIGYMILPERLMEKYNSKLSFYSCPVPVFEQFTLAKFISEGYFERHINRLKKVFRQRRDTLVNCIKNSPLAGVSQIFGDNSGIHILLKISNGMSQSELIETALKSGIKIHGISEYYSFPVYDIPENAVILGFSGIGCDDIAEAVEILSEIWKSED